LSGTLFGLAFLMKQPGIFFIAFGVSYLMFRFFSAQPSRLLKEKILNLMIFIGASLLPLIVTMVWLYTAGVFDKFWFWTVQYAAKYGTQLSFSEAFGYFKYGFHSATDGFLLLWIASGLGLFVTIFHRAIKDSRLFILLFMTFSFLSICPGFYFRDHYFITLLPAVSISVGIFFNYLSAAVVAFFKVPQLRFIGIGVFAVVALIGVNDQRWFYLIDDPVTISNKIYGDNPFDESLVIARFINSRSSPTDRIAVFGSEPQIYFYTHNMSATGYIYTYSLMEIQSYSLEMQNEMIREVELTKPKFIVDVHIATSWLVQEGSEKKFFGWIDEFLKNNYTIVGVVDINTSEPTVYKWYDDIKNYTIQLPSYVLIYERVPDKAKVIEKPQAVSRQKRS
jgi:hypothetical protein